jgi:mRNA-degrading endonuclease RelE of RelBE toxin-antitoxin system
MPKARDVKLSRRAEKALEAIEARFREDTKETIRELSLNPLLGKKLKGEFEGLRSYRVGSFCIVDKVTSEVEAPCDT